MEAVISKFHSENSSSNNSTPTAPSSSFFIRDILSNE